MEFDLILKGIEFFTRKEVYLCIAAPIWIALLVISLLNTDSNNSFGYIIFSIVLCSVVSVLWPLSIIVVLVIYIFVTLDNIKKMRKKYKELNKKLCGITNC